jgi:hypothetical protein
VGAKLNESYDRHDWTLRDHRITQLCVDAGACRMQSWTLQDSLEIRLGARFSLTLIDGTSREIDPEYPEQLAPLLTMVGREIVHMVVTRSGSLSVRLSDGSLIEIDSSSRHEAFQVNGGGAMEGIAYVAQSGGGPPRGI